MARKCENCDKGIMWGHRVSHSKRRTNHVFKPNLQKKTFLLQGKKVSMKLCTNCIKLYRKIDRELKAKLKATTEEATVTTPVL